jgi:hypothetical protein
MVRGKCLFYSVALQKVEDLKGRWWAINRLLTSESDAASTDEIKIGNDF